MVCVKFLAFMGPLKVCPPTPKHLPTPVVAQDGSVSDQHYTDCFKIKPTTDHLARI